MRLKASTLKGALVLALLFAQACATKPANRVLTISEQIEVDTAKAESLSREFEKQVTFVNNAKAEKFLNAMAKQLSSKEPGFENDPVRVRIHQDTSSELHRFFSFPGTLISIPDTFLKNVEFENELAAALSYELAHVLNRYLATKVDSMGSATPLLFGPQSVFVLNQSAKALSIQRGTRLLYLGGYDPRGMASIFRRYADYYVSSASGLFKKQVDFNIREAQRAKSEFLPSLKPIVRSGEFIQFKKGLQKRD